MTTTQQEMVSVLTSNQPFSEKAFAAFVLLESQTLETGVTIAHDVKNAYENFKSGNLSQGFHALESIGTDTLFALGLKRFGVFGKEVGGTLTPFEQLNQALQRSKVYEQFENISASSPNAREALADKYSALEGAQLKADKIDIMPNGNVRYYEKFRNAKTVGPTSGSRFVTEYNLTTGTVTMWNETYDSLNNINRISLKGINGIPINAIHFPPTLQDMLTNQTLPYPNF